MSEERFRGEPRPRIRRAIVIVAVTLAALAVFGFLFASRQPTYFPPPGDEIDILLELAGVFPDNYKILWREHAALRSTDPEAQSDPSLLGDASFMHRLTTGPEGEVRVEVEYRFYELDRDAVEEPPFTCWCGGPDRGTSCLGQLAFGNYEFSLSASYNGEACTEPISPKRREEFSRSMQTADRLIGLYLKPLRRKPAWL
jgi:hypothetical protein